MAGKGGGAWKVAYADFVTAMMAFFLVMWITAQSKDVKQAVAQYFREPLVRTAKFQRPGPSIPSHKGGAASQARRSRGKKTADPPPGSPDDKGKGEADSRPQMLAVYDGTRSTLGSTVLFAEESAQLDDEGKARLTRLLPTLAGKLNKIEVRGHASRRPLPSGSPFPDAWQLCYARCQVVMKFLEQEGVEPTRIRLSQAGPFEPPAARENSDEQQQDSRVDIYMLGEFAEDLVGAREGKHARPKTP